MPPERFDPQLELETAMTTFAQLAALGTGDEPVPSCDGWTMGDLVAHLGTIHRWAAGIVISGQRIAEPEPLIDGPPADWYTGTAAALLAVLQAVSRDEPTPNFSRIGETAAFWSRRQMHETIVHTVDAQQALGFGEGDWAVPSAQSADGIDEVLQVFFPRLTARGRRPVVRSRIRLVATDIDQAWVIGPGEGDSGTPVQLHRSRGAEAVVTGTASDLYLALWHRVPRSCLQFVGDDGIALLDGPTTP